MKSPVQPFRFMGGTKPKYEVANRPHSGLLNPRMMGPACCTGPVRIRYEVRVDSKLDEQRQSGVRPRRCALSWI